MTDSLASPADIVDHQLETQGVSSIRVSDGQVFTFSTRILETLLEQSREAGKVVVFVQNPDSAVKQ